MLVPEAKGLQHPFFPNPLPMNTKKDANEAIPGLWHPVLIFAQINGLDSVRSGLSIKKILGQPCGFTLCRGLDF